jgi:hypothetical protein
MIPDEENALVTGDYVIMSYRLLGDPTNKVYILDGHERGEWWYSLNDGLLDVGRFASREAAIEQATNWIEQYRRDLGGYVRSVSVA